MKHFVAGATARTAAELAGVHRNSGVRFYCKLREKIAINRIVAINLAARSSWTNRILAEKGKANEVEERLAKQSFLAF